MSCSLLTTGKNAASSCKAIGGIETVYIANSDLIASYAVSGTGPNEEISSIVGATGVFYQFKQIQETSSFTSTPNANIQNGSLFFETILTLVFTNYNSSLRYVIKTLAENNLVAIAKMKTGEYVLLGQSAGLDVNGGEGGSGVASGDRNGASLTFRGVESAPPMTLSSTFVSSPSWAALVNANVI